MWVAEIDSEREKEEETHLYFSCVSLISLLSSSILSAVNLRTITSSMVSTTSPFSPRLRLQGEHMPSLPMNLWIRWFWLPMILAKIIVWSPNYTKSVKSHKIILHVFTAFHAQIYSTSSLLISLFHCIHRPDGLRTLTLGFCKNNGKI